jgi:hypothetical protein
MSKTVLRQLKKLQPGCLICVTWFDASIGKALTSGEIDIPVRSWGIYLGLLGDKMQHLILAQNTFKYNANLFDVDYTSIPVSWQMRITVINPDEVNKETAGILLNSFLQGHRRILKRRTHNGS